jgi:hypothetical protein
MPEHRYDVFDLSDGGGAFEVVSDEEMARLRDQCDTGDTGCDDGKAVEMEIAHAVSAATAAHLVGLRPTEVAWLESRVAEFGSMSVGNLSENYEVRRSCDDD